MVQHHQIFECFLDSLVTSTYNDNSSFQANRADIVTLDAGEVYSAVKQFGLVVIAKEIYSDGRFTSHITETSLLCGSEYNCLWTSCRRLHSVCGCGEKQQFGHTVPAGPQELSQWGPMDSWMESTTRLPAVPQLPELVQGAAAESR